MYSCENFFARVHESERAYAFWLVSVPWIGNGPIPRLLEYYGSPKDIYKASDEDIEKIPGRKVNTGPLLKYRKEHDIFRKYDEFQRSGMKLSFVFDEDYPLRLKNIPDPPYGLFYMGDLPENNKLSVAVIGARQCSEYGRYIASNLGKALGSNDINLISGMAVGIDGISQSSAIASGGRSFAVLGSGADICYPESNKELYEDLKKAGGIISSYPPGTKAISCFFPPRNRIVSGLSDAVVVIEARTRSGTLITVDMALEQGRDIYAVPGRLGDELSAGCNGLIGHGARVYLDPEIFMQDLTEDHMDVFEYGNGTDCFRSGKIIPLYDSERDKRHRNYCTEKKHVPKLDQSHLEIYSRLSFTPKTPEEIHIEILNEGKDSPGETGICLILMELCLQEHAFQVSPGYYIKKSS